MLDWAKQRAVWFMLLLLQTVGLHVADGNGFVGYLFAIVYALSADTKRTPRICGAFASGS